MSQCILSTDHALWMAGENRRCENTGRFPLPNELGEYLVGGLVCKDHLRYLLERDDKNPNILNWQSWVETFKNAGIAKGQMIKQMQKEQWDRSVMAELS